MSSTTTTTTTNFAKSSKIQPHIRLSTTSSIAKNSQKKSFISYNYNNNSNNNNDNNNNDNNINSISVPIEKTQLSILQKVYNYYLYTTPAYLLSTGELIFFNAFCLLLLSVFVYYILYLLPQGLYNGLLKLNYYLFGKIINLNYKI
ncbi:unnamed protein product [Candida verbasci]|uniref:Uncharacterized protein n=1 Tax=Candida verbasci TaxID=1227364 RepID=A0A9W4U0N1_9ASCO|nr:unnamed protein product [Candida verbasci]